MDSEHTTPDQNKNPPGRAGVQDGAIPPPPAKA